MIHAVVQCSIKTDETHDTSYKYDVISLDNIVILLQILWGNYIDFTQLYCILALTCKLSECLGVRCSVRIARIVHRGVDRNQTSVS